MPDNERNFEILTSDNADGAKYMLDGSMKTYWYPKDIDTEDPILSSDMTVIRAYTDNDEAIFGIRLAISQYDTPEMFLSENRTGSDFANCAYEGLMVELCDWTVGPGISSSYSSVEETRTDLQNCYECHSSCGLQRMASEDDTFPHVTGSKGGPVSGHGVLHFSCLKRGEHQKIENGDEFGKDYASTRTETCNLQDTCNNLDVDTACASIDAEKPHYNWITGQCSSVTTSESLAGSSGAPQIDLGFESSREFIKQSTVTLPSPRPSNQKSAAKKWGGKKSAKSAKSAKVAKSAKFAKSSKSAKNQKPDKKKNKKKGKKGRKVRLRRSAHTGYDDHISGNVVQITSRDFGDSPMGIYGFKIFEMELLFQPNCIPDETYLEGPTYDTACDLTSTNYCENCAHQCSATQHCLNEIQPDGPGIESFGAYSCVCVPGYVDNGLPRLGLFID